MLFLGYLLPWGLLLLAFVVVPEDPTDSRQSVVIIHTDSGSGYGVAWGGPGKIVTALHLVAGKKNIEIRWENQKTVARIDKIHQEADLAMLQMEQTLPIPELEIYPGNAPLGTDLNYWEQQPRSSRMNGKTAKLQKMTALARLNPRLVQTDFAKALCSADGESYPALGTDVFKFEEPNIKKAHSGSPLTYQNRIVGLVDGGDNFSGKSCVWAIPATEFNKLQDSGVEIPDEFQVCSSEKLYSGLRSDNPFLSRREMEIAQAVEASEANPVRVGDGSGQVQNFTLNYIAPFEVIYDNLLEEDQVDLQELLEDEDYNPNVLSGQYISVYQEASTGATIAVPSASRLEVTSKDGYTIIKASSPEGGVDMYFLVQKTAQSTRGKLDAIEQVKAFFLSDREWSLDEAMPDDEENELDSEEPYYSLLMDRLSYNDEGDEEAEFFASITIDQNDLLAVAVQVNDWNAVDANKVEEQFFVLMEACAILTDFAYY